MKIYDMHGGEEDVMVLREMIEQCVADSERWFPEMSTPPLLALCVAGEVGEVCNIMKKVERGSITVEEAINPTSPDKSSLPEEIVDVLVYLCNLMGHGVFHDVNWQAVWDKKRQFNEERFGRGKHSA